MVGSFILVGLHKGSFDLLVCVITWPPPSFFLNVDDRGSNAAELSSKDRHTSSAEAAMQAWIFIVQKPPMGLEMVVKPASV